MKIHGQVFVWTHFHVLNQQQNSRMTAWSNLKIFFLFLVILVGEVMVSYIVLLIYSAAAESLQFNPTLKATP